MIHLGLYKNNLFNYKYTKNKLKIYIKLSNKI